MNGLGRLILREICDVHTYRYQRGETSQITRRRWYGLSRCEKGQITYSHNGRTHVSAPGTAVILPQGQTYTLRCDRDGVFHVINFTCDQFSCPDFLILPVRSESALISDYEYIRRLFVFKRSRLKVHSLFYGMLDRLPARQDEAFCVLGPAVRCLEDHIADPALSNRMLAQAAGVSEVYFRQLFARQYGVTPRQYILEVRMHKAQQLLTEGALKTADVAEACGFSSAYHFCRSFRQRTGQTPGEYRRLHRREGI